MVVSGGWLEIGILYGELERNLSFIGGIAWALVLVRYSYVPKVLVSLLVYAVAKVYSGRDSHCYVTA